MTEGGVVDDGDTGATTASTGSGDAADTTGSTSDPGSTGDGATTGGADASVLHVSEAGQDSNPGTAAEPMRTIQWALGQASADVEIDTIRVAGGTYEADVANDDAIVLIDGVSLYGGWSPDFGARDRTMWPSVIVDGSSQEPPNTSPSSPARLVGVPAGISAATVFDGFVVEIGLGAHVAGIFVEGDATISGNHFTRGVSSDGVTASAISIAQASPHILGNRIDLDYALMTSQLRGIAGNGSDPTIVGNVIMLAGATGSHYGFFFGAGAPQIVGNSIAIADGPNQWIAWMEADATPLLDNNVMQTQDGTGICVGSLSAGAIPTGLHNNLLQCNYAVWGNGDSTLGQWTTISQVHAGLVVASGNVKLAGPLVDAATDLRLDAGAPCSVARGGLDVSATYPDDFDGLPRTDPLSMGAYEWDDACQ